MSKFITSISAVTLTAAMFSQYASAAVVNSAEYNDATDEFTVTGESDKNVNVILLNEGKGISSLQNVSNSSNPFLSINQIEPEDDGTFNYTFKKTIDTDKNYVMLINDGTTHVAEQYIKVFGESHKIYVDGGRNGSDSYAGTAENPVKTIDKAKELVREYKAENPVGDIEVIVKEGTYYITSPIEFNESDSGTADGKVTYKAEGNVIFSGATKLTSVFSKVADKEVLNRLPNSARENIRVADTSAINQEKLKIQYNIGLRIIVPPELYFNGKKQTVARWPNDDYAEFEEYIDENNFRASAAKTYKWQNAENAYIMGYLENPYYRQAHSFSVDGDVVTVDNTLRETAKYKIVNAIEELDMPGEWYADTDNKKLYFYPPKTISPSSDTIEIATYGDNFIKMNGTSYVTFEGFEFKNSTVESGNIGNFAIEAANVNNVEFKNITVDNCVGSGISLSGYDSKITGCNVYNMGGNGIALSGGVLRTLTPGNSIASDNYTYSLSEYRSPHSAGNNLSGVGNTMANNVFHGSAGTLLGFGGTDCRIRNNEFYNGTIETKDSGLVYHQGKFTCYGNVFQYNYFHDCQRPNDSTEGGTAMNNALYWDNLLSGQTAKHNIFKIDDTVNRALLASGRDNVFSENTVIGSAEVSMTDWTTYCWSIQNGKPVHQVEGTLCSFAQVGFDSLKEIDHGAAPWLTIFPKVHQIYLDLVAETDDEGNVTKYNLFIPTGNEKNGNLLFNTNSDVAQGVANETLGNAEYKGNFIYGDIEDYPYDKTGIYDKVIANNTINERLPEEELKAMFVDYDAQDFRLTNEAVTNYGFSENILSESNFDIETIGTVTVRNVTNTSFDLLYPANESVEKPEKVTLKWSKADFADQYRYVIAEDKNLTNIVLEGETFNDTVVVGGLQKDKTYYWSVYAENLSRQNMGEWMASSVRSFETGNIDILVNSSEFKGSDGTYSGFDGNAFDLVLDLENTINERVTAKIIVSLYDSDDKLVKLISEDITIEPGAEIYEISGNLEGNADYTVKAFIWNTLEGAKPLTEKIKLWN